MAGVKRGKYYTHVEPKLLLIEAWARDGTIDEDIAVKLGVAYSTFREYVKQHKALSAALKRGKEVADIEVENALFKRAIGYEYTEKKYEPVAMSDEEYELRQQIAVNQYKLEHPEATMQELRVAGLAVSRYRMALVEEKVKEVVPDTTAQIFWLKNRKPVVWRDKQEIDVKSEVKNTYEYHIRQTIQEDPEAVEALKLLHRRQFASSIGETVADTSE